MERKKTSTYAEPGSTRLTAKLAVAVLVTAGSLGLVGEIQQPTPSQPDRSAAPVPPARVVFTQLPVAAATPENGGYGTLPLGSRIAIVDSAEPTATATSLTTGFAAAGRPSVSFDGRRILFVGRRNAADPLSVWEMTLDDGDIKRIAAGSDPMDPSRPVAYKGRAAPACTEAVYLSTMYTMDADRPVFQIAYRSQPSDGGAGSLFTCRLDGSATRRITFTPRDVSSLLPLSDGRLLFSMSTGAADRQPVQPVGAASKPPSALFTINTDGTDIFPFAGVHDASAIRSASCETSDGWIVFVESDGKDRYAGGSLVAVPRTRSLRQRRLVAADLDGYYLSPAPWEKGQLLVSHRSKTADSYGLFTLDLRSGERTRRVYDDPGWHEMDAVRVCAHPAPAGRSSVVKSHKNTGRLYGLDAYLSDTANGRAIQRGTIKKLRVIRATTEGRQAPVQTASNPTHARPRGRPGGIGEAILGEIPVETDGSFFLELPARTPFRLETLGADGAVLQAMHSWIWVMPNEQRGCIGCHEDRELTPPNRHVRALRRDPHRLGDASIGRVGNAATWPSPIAERRE